MQELIDKVQELVAFELERANTIHPPKFNSYHEAYAVIREEIEEGQAELQDLSLLSYGLWEHVKTDYDEAIIETLNVMEYKAVMAAAELIQVAAMCRKARK